MSGEYGPRIGKAIEAVAQLHSDTSRLLRDCGQAVWRGRTSITGSYATEDLTWDVEAEFWMAEAVYRYFDASHLEPLLVEGLTVCFHDIRKRFVEPLLIMGQVKYLVEPVKRKKTFKGWDLWDAGIEYNVPLVLDQPIRPVHEETKRIAWMKAIVVKLYSIQSIDDVVRLMNRVREY